MKKLVIATIGALFALPAISAPIDLDSTAQATCGDALPTTTQPPAGFGSVTGGATTFISPCWFFPGENDNADGYTYGGQTFTFLSKNNDGNGSGTDSGEDVGLDYSTGDDIGSWSFDADLLDEIGDFILAFKQGSDYGIWLFEGANNDFSSGFYSLWQGGNPPTGALSHLSLYIGDDTPPTIVPEPGTLALLGAGLILVGFARRRTLRA